MSTSQPVDFALSYAGPDESVAREVSRRLQELGFQVFFARERSHLLVGLDGESLFEKLFLAAKQVVVFISADYKDTWLAKQHPVPPLRWLELR